MLKTDLAKSETLKVPSFEKKKRPETKNIIDMAAKSLLPYSSINKTKKPAPRIKKIEGRMIFENFVMS